MYIYILIVLQIVTLSILKVNASEIDYTLPTEYWNSGTYELREKLITIGYSKNVSTYMINKCKEFAKNPRHCVEVSASIGTAESNNCQNASRYNCWWVLKYVDKLDANWKPILDKYWRKIKVLLTYSSYGNAFDVWLKSYNKYWYKAKDMSFFYPKKWEYSPSRYCTDENSSNSTVGCPFWLRNSTKTFNYLSK